MKPNIDPTVDCVFKAILGSKENTNLLIHFLNAVLKPAPDRRIVEVELLNPFNPKEFESDKLSIVDIKARDEHGTLHQIEMQVVSYSSLKARMLYGWASLYASQLTEGDSYSKLRPVICIWVMVETMFRETNGFHLHFQLVDRKHRLVFDDHFALHMLQLKVWKGKRIRDELDRWTRFLLEGEDLDTETLPEWMKTPEMEQAMGTLRRFSEKEEDRLLYEGRQAYIREQRTREDDHRREIEEMRQRLNAAERKERAAEQEKLAAEQEKLAAEQEKLAAETRARRIEGELAELRARLGPEKGGTSKS